MEDLAVAVRGVEKTYRSTKKKVRALKKINLTINKGEIFGVLGQNGAGKTTLINILSTLLVPDKGEVTIFDINALKRPNDVRKIIGYAGQDSEKSAYYRLTAFETLLFFAYTFRDVRKESIKRTIRYISGKIGFSRKLNSQFSTLSGGEKQAVIIMRALVHKPKLCFLDEPTKSLDPVTARKFRAFLREYIGKNDITVVLTTHNMQEAEELCDRIALINKGKVQFVGTPSDFKKIMDYTDRIILGAQIDRVLFSKLAKIPSVIRIKRIQDSVVLYTKEPSAAIRAVNSMLKKVKIEPKMTVRSATVEDAFVKAVDNGK